MKEILKTIQRYLSKKKQEIQNLYVKKEFVQNVWTYTKKEILSKKEKSAWIIIVPVLFVYNEILLRIFSGNFSFETILYPILFAVSIGILCSGIFIFLKPKMARIAVNIILYAAAFFFTVESMIQNSFQLYMTPSAILTGTGDVVGEYASQLIRAIVGGIPRIFLFFLPVVLYTKFENKIYPRQKLRKAFGIEVCSVAMLLFLLLLPVVYGGNNKEKYTRQFEFNSATETFGLLTSMRLGVKYAMFGNQSAQAFVLEEEMEEEVEKGKKDLPSSLNFTSLEAHFLLSEIDDKIENGKEPVVYEENKLGIDFEQLSKIEKDEIYQSLHSYVASLSPSRQNEYTGLFKGKNLILICAEAFSDAVIQEELTPTLYRFSRNGFYFSNFYQPQWGGSTSTGEFSFMMGLAPLNTVETMKDAMENNNYFTLGNQLQRLNYHSIAYHDGTHTYYDRNLTHENLGYDTFMAYGNGLEKISGAWTGDKEMLDKTVDIYLDKQPFSIYYMTVSGHFPYEDSDEKVSKYLNRVEKVLGNSYKQTTLDYYCYQMELEEALKALVEKLEKAGIAEDTVICMTADHYPYGLTKSGTYGNEEDYLSDLYGYTPKTPWERDRNACIIWSACLENENKDMACEISTPTYTLDIVPTLSNLFGTEYDSRLLVGRDVFSDSEPLVMWPDYSWVTEEGKYDASTGIYDSNKGKNRGKKEKAYIDKVNQIVSNKLKFSKDVVDYDYYGKLFGEDVDTKKEK